jgi:hypothetical protein
MDSQFFIYSIHFGSVVLTPVVGKSSVFRDITPSSPDISEGHVASIFSAEELTKQETNMKQISCLAHSSTLKMEVTFSSEISVDFQQITQHFILVGTILS